MANYDSNYAIAQEISARIGVSPIPFDSVYSIALEIYNELGGEPTQFDSVYSILLGILPLVEGGVASKVIDDNVITTVKTWSSSKINSELGGKASIEYVDEKIDELAGTANSEIEGKETEDFKFVAELPASGETDELVVIKGDNADTLYKYVEGSGWTVETPDATKLYFDVENEALYSYVTADNQFARISMVNTIVVGSNLNNNADLKALKTPGVYSVVQRLHSSTKGDYIKNWTLTVESVDYEEYDRSDSVYQRLVSNYTIKKRTWSATRASNDGWGSFSTYYAGEIKDTTTSKYYTWSSDKLNNQLSLKTNKSDYTIRMIVDSSTYNLTFDLSSIDNVSTDGIYSVTIISNVITGADILVGVGDLIVFSANMGGTLIVVQSLRITYIAEGTETIEITRKSLDGGQNWQDIMFSNAVIDDTQNPGEILPYSTYSATKINQLLSGKQNTISDLSDIRSGATLGATALQSVPSEYVTDTELSTELADYATTSAMTSGLAAKQDTLTAGTNIEISGTTISATYQTASTADIEALFA